MKKAYELSEKDLSCKNKQLMEAIGRNVKDERLNKGMTRMDLAFYAKTTESMICCIENGKKSGLSIYTAVKISEALDISLDILFKI